MPVMRPASQDRPREWIDRVGQNGNTAERWQHIPKQFDTFSRRLGTHIGQARDIPAGPS